MFTVAEQRAIFKAKKIIESKANENAVFNSAIAAQDYCFLTLSGKESENFLVLFMDTQNRLISSEIMFTGTINQSPVFPREIAKKALLLNAAAVILSHNHPSGIAEPSSADRSITSLIVDCLNLVDCRVLDHIIVGSKKCFSFAENGLL